jgi:hypothetical protein
MLLALTLSVSREERCEVLACFHVVVKLYRYSLEERMFIVKTYWITGNIKNCQSRFGLSRSTYQRAAKNAGLHSYQFRVVQELKQQDYDKRMTYCRWFQTLIDENAGILDYTWFSDEAWFHLSGYVNFQNTRLWGSENPHALFE